MIFIESSYMSPPLPSVKSGMNLWVFEVCMGQVSKCTCDMYGG